MKKRRARGQKTPNRINRFKECHDVCIQFLINHYKLKDSESILIENRKKIDITIIKQKEE